MATSTQTPHDLPKFPVPEKEEPLKSAPLIDIDNWNQPQTTSPAVKSNQPLIQFLSAFKCRAPIFPNDVNVVVRVLDNATLGDALKKMTSHRILALPVVDHHTGKPIYILTMKDIVAYFVAHFDDGDFKTDFWTTLTNFFYVPEYCDEIANKPLSQLVGVIGSFGLEPLVVIREDQTVYEAAKLMLEKNAHRVLVVDESGNMTNLITQSRIVQFIPSVLESDPRAQKTIKELGLGFKKIYAVKEDEITFKAFRSMINKDLSSLAVIDSNKRLVGNLSSTDFKLAGFESQYWNYLGRPVKEYLQKLSATCGTTRIRNRWLHSTRTTDKDTDEVVQVLVTVKPDDTLLMAVKYLTFFRVHRVYIVDDEHRPLGVISVGDVLKEFLETAQA